MTRDQMFTAWCDAVRSEARRQMDGRMIHLPDVAAEYMAEAVNLRFGLPCANNHPITSRRMATIRRWNSLLYRAMRNPKIAQLYRYQLAMAELVIEYVQKREGSWRQQKLTQSATSESDSQPVCV